MKMRPVVAAVDGSEPSMRAVEWSALEAQRHRAPLRIVSTLGAPSRAYVYRTPDLAGSLRSASARALGDAVIRAGEVAPDLTICVDLLHGPLASAITGCGAAALMLVVGEGRLGAHGPAFLSSVTRYTATHAACPVVVVQDDTDAVRGEVAVGIRDPRNIGDCLAFAFEEAALRHATLVAVHAWRRALPELGGRLGAAVVTERRDDARAISAQLAEDMAAAIGCWRDKYPSVPVRQDVVEGHPALILPRYSARADLVVLGRHDRAAGRAAGAVRDVVLHRARGPVAIVP